MNVCNYCSVVGGTSAPCQNSTKPGFTTACAEAINVNFQWNDTGIWHINGIYGASSFIRVTVIPKAQVYKAEAMVVKTNTNRALVMNPEHVLRRIVLPLRTDIGDMQERC